MPEVEMGLYRSVFDAKLGKGSTYDMLVYPVQLAISLFGPIKKMQSLTYRLENKVGITNLVFLEHENGIYTNITNSKAARGVIPSEIVSPNGATLIFSNLTRLRNIRFYELNSNLPIREIRSSGQNPFTFEIQDFVKMIETSD
jgi:scyllo-inositol 2-dehydrogenase (NADP+)